MFWTSHSRCSQPWWFPKAFAFYHPLNLLARKLGFSLKSEQREAFWFLSNLRKYHSAVSNLCSTPQANSWGERCSFVQDNEKFVFQKAGQLWWCFTFSSRGKNHIFGAYSPTLNISKLCCETTAAIISSAWLFRLSPSSRSSTGFFGILPLIFDLPENTALQTEMTLKTCFGITGYHVHH